MNKLIDGWILLLMYFFHSQLKHTFYCLHTMSFNRPGPGTLRVEVRVGAGDISTLPIAYSKDIEVEVIDNW